MSLKFEFSSIKELKQFMALFFRGNEELIKREVEILDKSTDELETALENDSKKV
jgi:hypothetical protein